MAEARRNLRKVRAFSESEVDDELRVIADSVAEERTTAGSAKFYEVRSSRYVCLTRGSMPLQIFYKANIKRTIAASSLFSLNQISGSELAQPSCLGP
jgi:hypothetical protein